MDGKSRRYDQKSRRSTSRSRSRSYSPRRSNSSKYDDRQSSRRRDSSSSHFVCIRNLPADISLDVLQRTVSQTVGSYVFVQLLHQPGSSSTKALVEFDDADLAKKCSRKMDRVEFYGRKLDVVEVKDVEAFLHKYGAGDSLVTNSKASSSSTSNYESARVGEKSYDVHQDRKRGENGTSQPWLFSGDAPKHEHLKGSKNLPEDSSRLQELQIKLWSSVWKTRLQKKETIDQSAGSHFGEALKYGEQTVARKVEMNVQQLQSFPSTPSSDPMTSVAVDVMTGAFHIRRALETIRKSDRSHDAFRTSALFLRQFNDELSDWRDMYFSRENEDTSSGLRTMPKYSLDTNEKDEERNLLEVKGEGDLHVAPFASTTIAAPLHGGTSWFMIGPAQPRFSSTAAIRRNALAPLMEVSREKAKTILTQFAHVAPASALSRCIRALSVGGYVDFDWFLHFQAPMIPGVPRLGDSGVSYSNWYRCFDFVMKIGEIIGTPSEYLTSMMAYRHVIESWWRHIASADIQSASLMWLPFYELFDKSWRVYAAKSMEYRTKLHVFDAWWVFHQLDPTALKWRVPLPPYEAQMSTYVQQVAVHYEDMLSKPMPSEILAVYNSQRFGSGLDGCSLCGDCDHKLVENGRSSQLFCPFASRRVNWCSQMYESDCESETCYREGRHVCAHCGNPEQLMLTCPNCRSLIS